MRRRQGDFSQIPPCFTAPFLTVVEKRLHKIFCHARSLCEYGQDVDYDLILKEASALSEAERHMIPLLSNLSALLHENLHHINWVGYYPVTVSGNLVVGPFQGKPACMHIPKGHGVCGTALARGETICVRNVHTFPGHIACDAASISEIVVPIHGADGGVKAVLDIDSPIEGRFFDRDKTNLEMLCALINVVIWNPCF